MSKSLLCASCAVAAALVASIAAGPAAAQTFATPFNPTGNTTLAVSTTSGLRVALPSSDTTALLQNTGAAVAYCKFGNSSVSATTGDTPIQPGQAMGFYAGASVDVSCITAAGSTVVGITTGTGIPVFGIASNLAASSSVTIDQTTPGVTNGVQVNAALPAGTSVVGKVGIDQTTPGTTNGVQVTAALPAGTNVVGKVSIDQTTPGTTNAVQLTGAVPTGTNTIGKISIDQTTPGTTNAVQLTGAVPAGSNTIGKVSIDQTTPGTTNAVQLAGAVPTGTNTIGNVGLAAGATGGCTPGGLVTAASTNSTSVKGSAGTFCGGHAINTTATVVYIRFYDAASAPTCSSSTNFVLSIPVPASSSGAGLLLDFGPFGAAFSNGIAWCVTGGGSSTDNTNAVAGVYINYTYK